MFGTQANRGAKQERQYRQTLLWCTSGGSVGQTTGNGQSGFEVLTRQSAWKLSLGTRSENEVRAAAQNGPWPSVSTAPSKASVEVL
jgi:hypothetical protein